MAKLIPDRGAWMEFETRKSDYIAIKFNRKRTIPVTIFLRALASLTPEDFQGYGHAHVEGYLLFNGDLILAVMEAARKAGAKISLDLASYTVVETARDLLPDPGIVDQYLQATPVDDDTLAFDAISEVGPAGQFLTHRHTFSKCRIVPFRSTLPNVPSLMRAVDGTVDTDLTLSEMLSLAKIARDIQATDVVRMQIDANVVYDEWFEIDGWLQDVLTIPPARSAASSA